MRPNLFKPVLAACCRGTMHGSSLLATESTVADADDLKFALDELVTEFHTNQTAVHVKVSFGSSGNFCAKLQNKLHSTCISRRTSSIRANLSKRGPCA